MDHLPGRMEDGWEGDTQEAVKDQLEDSYSNFPILEKSLLEDKSEAPLESGFSAYVPAEYKDYQVTVLIDREE